MESKTAKALNLKYHPVTILWSDDRPEKAMGFKQGKWGCVMWMLAAAAKGKTAAFDKSTYGCWGGGVGLGFGNQYLNFPGGIECFYPFCPQEMRIGRRVAKWRKSWNLQQAKILLEKFRHGEGYMKSPELVKKFIDSMPIIGCPQNICGL